MRNAFRTEIRGNQAEKIPVFEQCPGRFSKIQRSQQFLHGRRVRILKGHGVSLIRHPRDISQLHARKQFFKRSLLYVSEIVAVLLVMVVLLPTVLVNELGMSDPIFCKYLCPQGILEGAIPLALVNTGIRSALGALFTWKAAVLAAVILLSVLFWRPFCKWLCPLGAFYALFNRVSLFQMQVNSHRCVSCGKCANVCPMDVDITQNANHAECIRCGRCIKACPAEAICYRYGFGNEKTKENS